MLRRGSLIIAGMTGSRRLSSCDPAIKGAGFQVSQILVTEGGAGRGIERFYKRQLALQRLASAPDLVVQIL